MESRELGFPFSVASVAEMRDGERLTIATERLSSSAHSRKRRFEPYRE